MIDVRTFQDRLWARLLANDTAQRAPAIALAAAVADATELLTDLQKDQGPEVRLVLIGDTIPGA